MLNNVSWISSPKQHDGSYYFRKDFDVKETPMKAVLYICALGLGVCQINGSNATEDVYTTPFTKYDTRVLYQSYDVTNLIVRGKNAICVHVGNGMYNNPMKTWNDFAQSWRAEPKLAAKLIVTFEDGTNFILETDKTWKVADGAYTYNVSRSGAIYDARLKKSGCANADFDDSEWSFARKTREAGGILEPMAMPPCRVCEVFSPVSYRNGIYDFGINMSGRARVRCKGAVGQEIVLKYAELLHENGELNTQITDPIHEAEGSKLKHEEIIICSGGEDEYASDFVYYGFRYVKVENAPEDFEITAEFIHTDLEVVGTFTSDNEMLNKIHKASLQATLSNHMGIPTDCPHREQNGWTGDAQVSAEQALMNFDMVDAYKKWLRDIKDCQRPNGQIPGIVPTSNYGYNWGSGPAWDSAFTLIPWYIYRNTGDTSIIKELWDSFELYMGYFERMSDDYIANFGIGDWCSFNPGDRCPAKVTDTAYLYADCVAMSKMAAAIGKDSGKWDATAKKVKAAWRSVFMNDESIKHHQTYYACAIYQGLLNEDEIPEYAKKLAQLIIDDDYHIDCGMLGIKYIFTALAENGYNDVLYRAVINPSMPSYAYWINEGATTLCETWNMQYSNNHHAFSEVDNWFYKYIGGINLDCGKIVIEPKLLDEVKNFMVTYKDISVERRSGVLYVTVPDSAVFILNGVKTELTKGTYTFNI